MDIIDRAALEERDRHDPLAAFRGEFLLPEGVIYLDGNSLGPLPRKTEAAVQDLITRQWGQHLIQGWVDDGWMELPARIGRQLAPMLGAAQDEVLVCDSTTVSLFKLLGSAVQFNPGRSKILSTKDNFPTNLYTAQGLSALLGGRVRLQTVSEDAIEAALDESIAVLLLTQVNFRTGAMLDIPRLTAAAHRHGALVIWDLSHSSGVLPLHLREWEVDLALGCGYKFLNGGPGAPAFVFIANRLQPGFQNPISGWLGHAAPFDFSPRYQPAPGILRATSGSPPVLSLAALACGVELAAKADLGQVRAKSIALGDLFLKLVAQECAGLDLQPACPTDSALRGSQVSFSHPQGYAIIQALIQRKVIGDFRDPNLLRFGLAPLFLRYVDIWDAVQHLKAVHENREWEAPEFQARKAVT